MLRSTELLADPVLLDSGFLGVKPILLVLVPSAVVVSVDLHQELLVALKLVQHVLVLLHFSLE